MEERKAKIVFYDLEVSRDVVEGYGNRWDFKVVKWVREQELMCYSYKWKGDKKPTFVSRHDFNTMKEFVQSLRDIQSEADIAVAHNACVSVDTPVLKQDLTWIRAGDLSLGDDIVGFDEKTPPGQKRRDENGKWRGEGERRIKPSKVTNISREYRDCVEVEFDNGDKVVTTKDHYWLGMSKKSRNQQWYRADSLLPGYRVNKFVKPWQSDDSYIAGWMCGFLEGEATLKSNGASIDFCQRPTVVLKKALDACKTLGIDISPLSVKRGGLGRQDTLYCYTIGGKWKTLETLGKLRADRLINNIDWEKFGSLNSTAKKDTTRTIVSVKDVGSREVAVIETSTRTYIADGYPMHNCKFDNKMSNRFFIKNNVEPPSPYFSIDTLKVARSKFKFRGNSLNELCEYLGIGSKEQITYSDLESDFMSENPSKKTIKLMKKYNNTDVELLEKLYDKLLPYIPNHPNMARLMNLHDACPQCGNADEDLIGREKYRPTKMGLFMQYKCKVCKKYFQSARPVDSTQDIKPRYRNIAGN